MTITEASADTSASTATCQLCTFHVGALFLGVNVLSVQEVLSARELTRVPLAHGNIQGLLNLRGQIVTAIDLRLRLGFPPRAAGAEPMFMIMRAHEGWFALLVDAVGDVIEVRDDTLETPPETLSAASRALVRGVHKLPSRLLHVLHVENATELVNSPP